MLAMQVGNRVQSLNLPRKRRKVQDVQCILCVYCMRKEVKHRDKSTIAGYVPREMSLPPSLFLVRKAKKVVGPCETGHVHGIFRVVGRVGLGGGWLRFSDRWDRGLYMVCTLLGQWGQSILKFMRRHFACEMRDVLEGFFWMEVINWRHC
jgi:hypothetical protein